MRRHPALVPLSEDHHHELVQARRLLAAADSGDAGERLAAGNAYATAFFESTVEHFRREEEELFPLYVRHAGTTPLLERILAEHMQLHGLAHALRTEAAAGDVPAGRLRELGTLLREHVRVEERSLFEEIQRVVPGEELEALR